ncbi:hypothetical protein [Hymenobacter sp. B1770]|uniref:hypothetical protein n=1 Tax=Hymenobacter sp. B1770 TaxID=1718788 RepID=UPI003CE8DD0D
MKPVGSFAGRRAWRLAAAGLLLAGRAHGQEAPVRRALVVKVLPQYLVMSGLWLEAEYRATPQARQAVTLTPQLYAGPVGRTTGMTSSSQARPPALADAQVRGAGLHVQHRRYRRPAAAAYAAGLYASYGLTFQHFKVSHEGLGWQELRDPFGLAYFEYTTARHTEAITRYGATAQVGYQLPLTPQRFSLEVYAGAGWRTGHSRKNGAEVVSQYTTGPSDYGHQGFYFPAGFKLGVAL